MNIKHFVILALVMFITALGLNLVIPLLPVYVTTMGASGFALGLIYSVFAVTRSLALPLVDRLAKIMGRLAPLRLGLILGVMVPVGFTLATQVAHLIVCRVLHGLSQSLMLPSVRSYIGDMIPPGREGRLMGLFEMAFGLGLAAGPFLGGWLKDAAGIKAAFWTMAALGLLTLLAVWFGFRPSPAPRRRPGASSAALAGAASGPARAQGRLRDVFKDQDMLAVGYLRASGMMATSLIWTFQLIYYTDVLKLSGRFTGLLLSAHLVVFALTQPLIGRLADRFDRHLLGLAAGLLTAPLIFLMAHPGHTLATVLLINVGLGVSVGASGLPQMALAVDYGRRHKAMSTAMTFMDLTFSAGLSLGPLLNGWLADIIGIGRLFHWAAAFQLFSCLIYFLLVKNRVRLGWIRPEVWIKEETGATPSPAGNLKQRG